MLGASCDAEEIQFAQGDLSGRRFARITLALGGCFAAWDAAGLDVALARVMGGAHRFPQRSNPVLETFLHSSMRGVGWAMLAFLVLAIFRPHGFVRALTLGERIQVPASVILSLVAVAAIKYASNTSCPWDLHEFGGALPYVPHWNYLLSDGGGGHCFPAGHASAGFAFIGGYFVLRRHRLALAGAWLATAVAAGLILGLSQQLRGAHFMSHTLWTAWVCWTVCGLVDVVFHRRAASARA